MIDDEQGLRSHLPTCVVVRHTPMDRSPSASSDERPRKKQTIKNYVNNLLTKHSTDEQTTRTQITIGSSPRETSAFQRYRAKPTPSISEEEETEDPTRTEQSRDLDETATELNFDPNPVVEERESAEQTYQQKVYLRQLQPPTPQPVEIQVQEVLIPPPPPKSPIHVRVAQRQARTPSPIVIKSAPPPPPASEERDQPIVYNKYIPPPKQPPRQIIIHHYPELPPKPRPIVVEQWLPYKPAPKRIIKHSLPAEALQPPPAPRNIIVSYAKPRAVIQVELVRLPVVKIDPQTYQQMSAAGQQQLAQNPVFQYEQDYLTNNNAQIDWRI